MLHKLTVTAMLITKQYLLLLRENLVEVGQLGGQSVALQGASSVESLETKIIQFF
jgi:hypothetical protein